MHLIYIDESGNTGIFKDPDQPFHLIAALIVDEVKIRPIEDGIDRIVEARFPDAWREDRFELHGAEIFGGKGSFSKVDPATRVQAVFDVVRLLSENQVAIGWVAAEKRRIVSDWHPHRLVFLLLIERLEIYLRSLGALGLIVADENKEIEQRLIDDLNIYKRTTTGFGWRTIRIRQIVDSVHFVRSQNNRLIQCADLIAYFTLRGYRLLSRLLERVAQDTPVMKRVFPDWLFEHATRSEAGVLQIYRDIEALTVFAKLFP